MKEYWIDFEGYTKITANSDEEAREKFYLEFSRSNTTVEVVGIEENEKGEK